ncbi:MAG: AI-2E family transporter [Treponema sp.]|jgi:predicted PurR-regulated permease PerM|nr:AI-2E family transporter [Treponema sp.]
MNDPSFGAPPPKPQRQVIQNLVFAAILVILFLFVCRLFAPFFTVLLWSTLLYVLMSPLHHRVIKDLDFTRMKGRILKNAWAAVFALATIVIILILLFFVSSIFFRQIMELSGYGRELLNERPQLLDELLERFAGFLHDVSAEQISISPDEIRRQIVGLLSSGLQTMVGISRTIALNLWNFFLGLVLMLFCLFFFYADGPYLFRLVSHTIPIRKEYIGTLTKKFMEITRNLFSGYILVALVQAMMACIIFSIFQVRGALVFAVLTFIAVFIPMIGGGLVWLPLGLARILGGNIPGGILFLAVSGIFISTLDNILRPMFLKDRIQLHPLIIFFAILGGLYAFGFNGIVLGPMVVILFLTVLDLFLTEHKIRD